MLTACAVIAGFALDCVLGDPRWLPHPVVWMGKAITFAEPRLRALFPATPGGQRAAGTALAALLPLLAFCLTLGVLALANLLHPAIRFLLETFWCYQLVAACELRRQSLHVVRELQRAGLPAARVAVARIVGRDTAALSEEGVLKATVETVAENTTDGVIAPLFYLMLGGAPLGMLYKAANTLDSMVGYKNERYRHFGWASARLDDVLNWLPSRLAALCLIAAAPLAGLSAPGAARIWRRDRRKHASPNAAQTEAAMAGALGVRLAGPASYFGVACAKEHIGDALRPIEAEDVARADRLMYAGSVLALLLLAAARVAVLGALGVLL